MSAKPENEREAAARALYPDVFRDADQDVAFWQAPSEAGYSETGWALFRRCRRTLEAVQTAYARLDASGLIAQRESGGAEPVAWRVEWPINGITATHFFDDEAAARTYATHLDLSDAAHPLPISHQGEVAPLYASPAEAQARIEALEAGISTAIRKLSDGDEHEHSRILDARDTLIALRDAPLRQILADALSGSTPKPERVEIDDAMVERAARAHDAEESAQKGEPSPWTHANCDDGEVSEVDCPDCKAFRDERLSTMRIALTAALTPSPSNAGEA